MGIIKHGDPRIADVVRKNKKWEAANPDRNWKTNLSQSQIDELADDMGEPEAKKSTNPLIDWLIESEQIT